MLTVQKTAIDWTGLHKRHNHAGHLVGVASLIDPSGVTIPGLTLQIEVKAPVDAVRCLYLLSIMQLRHRKRIRVYQLEVAPSEKRTHNGETTIRGPHEHFGDATPTAVSNHSVRCDNWSGVMQWFFERTCITPFEIEDPNHVEL
jgi:hypothetical protein